MRKWDLCLISNYSERLLPTREGHACFNPSRRHWHFLRSVFSCSGPSSLIHVGKLGFAVPMLCLNINALHFEKQIRLGKLLKYLQSALLKLLPLGSLRQKAVRSCGGGGWEWGGNCISVLLPVSAVCCCHPLPPGCRRWCHSAWWHGAFAWRLGRWTVTGRSEDGEEESFSWLFSFCLQSAGVRPPSPPNFVAPLDVSSRRWSEFAC